ncbi:hypothetical protein QBC44DRAFT_394083 [Cladorrhinum sp. PSN332]|nr:hypothetical protein QBC44DRAFT_394083 [Cladorrhinum sp. PSN332]
MGKSIISPEDFVLREATNADLDYMTHIHVKGFTEEPYEHYCFPLRNEFPDDYWRWTKQSCQDFLDQPEKYLIHILEAPNPVGGKVPAGVAVWNLAALTKAVAHPGLDQRKDVNIAHFEAFGKAAGQRFYTYFSEWADKQVNLSSLVVHPDFRLRGGGTMPVRWGMDRAQGQG